MPKVLEPGEIPAYIKRGDTYYLVKPNGTNWAESDVSSNPRHYMMSQVATVEGKSTEEIYERLQTRIHEVVSASPERAGLVGGILIANTQTLTTKLRTNFHILTKVDGSIDLILSKFR